MSSAAKEAVHHVNRVCGQETMEKSVILPICRADERKPKYCGVSVTRAKKNIRTKSKGRHKRGVLHTAGKKRT